MIRIKDSDKISLGENIKNARQNKGLTQKDFAEKLGISQSQLSKYENGKAVPDGEILRNMSLVLGESINMIMCEFEDPSRKNELEPLIRNN